MLSAFIRRTGTMAALVLTSLTGCIDGTGVEEDQPVIGGVVLTAGLGSNASGTTTVTPGAQTGSLTLRADAPNALTVRVLGIDLNDQPVVLTNSDEYEIRLVQGGVPVSSTIDGGYPYAFTVTPSSAPGTHTFDVQVRSLVDGAVAFDEQLELSIAAAP